MSDKQSRRDGMTIGELGRRAGVSVETVRYYERIGIFPQPERTVTGRRLFQDEHLQLLCFIKGSRDLGFTLKDTQALLSLRGKRDNCPEVAEILRRHLDSVRSRLSDLVHLEEVLAAAIARCVKDAPECSLIKMIETGSNGVQMRRRPA
jgi:MerR family mercuric resistance operon transcriptional regulator